MYSQRLEKIQHLIRQQGYSGLVINPGPSMVYLAGVSFHLSERPTLLILPAEGKPGLILARLEMLKVDQIPYPVEAFPFEDNPASWVQSYRQGLAFCHMMDGKIGVEPNSLRYLEVSLIKEAAPYAVTVAAGDLTARLRMLKDATEIAAMQKAVHIAQAALEEALRHIQPGMTEREFASELVLQLFRHGSDSALPFTPIVSAGSNGANPHAVPTDRPISVGDLLVVDWGAAYEGYFSDITRTFAVGDVDTEYRTIAAVTLEANRAGRSAAKPGVSIGKVDEAARSIIQAAGYGGYFTHRTGHGLGMESHEEPYCYAENTLLLEPGMVFTVEPGIYLPGRNGVRIEDDVVITETGMVSLTDMRRELVQIA